MKTTRRFKSSMVALLGLLLPGLGWAASVVIPFSGLITQVNDLNNVFGGTVAVGDSFTGSLTYDTSATDTNPNAHLGVYEYFTTPNGIVINIASSTPVTVMTDPAATDVTVTVSNDVPTLSGVVDRFTMTSPNSLVQSSAPLGTPVALATSIFSDNTATAFSSDALPSDLNFQDFAAKFISIELGTDLRIIGQITSQPPAEIPAPAGAWLLGSGLVALGGVVRRRGA